MSTIAMFSTYQPSRGFGGPSRIFHAREVLEAAGHRVVHVVIQANPASGDSRRDDIVRIVERPFGARVDHIYNDVDLGRRAAADERLSARLANELAQRGVDLVMLEQPFLVETAERVATRLGAPIVYSCHNVEYRLFRELERYVPDWRRSKQRSAEVRDLEVRATEIAEVVTTIADTDRQLVLDEFGVDSVVVPNGSTLADGDVPAAARRVDFAFVGSAYWPNTEGFAQIATPSLAFLPPTTRIHVAGSVGRELLRNPVIDRHHSVNVSRLELHGFVDADELRRLLASANAVIVPVFVGEGSNLKSADALASGSPVIMTEKATRGYEHVLAADDEGVTVVADAAHFREAMRRSLGAPPPDGPIGHERRDRLTWRRRLAPLVDAIPG